MITKPFDDKMLSEEESEEFVKDFRDRLQRRNEFFKELAKRDQGYTSESMV